MKAYSQLSKKSRPENALVNEKFTEDQVLNNTGGYVNKLPVFKMLERFLTLGCDSPTYYTNAKDNFTNNTKNLSAALNESFIKTVDMIVDFSTNNRAIKQDSCVFALAYCIVNAKEPAHKDYALSFLNDVCGIPTSLFHFCEFYNSLGGGWGSKFCKAINNWYTSKPVGKLGWLCKKYESRDGWSHRDVFRLSHIKAPDEEYNALFRYLTSKEFGKRVVDRKEEGTRNYDAVSISKVPNYIRKVDLLHTFDKVDNNVIKLIRDNKIVRENIPTQFLNSKVIWDEMLPNMRGTALLRNLNKLTMVGCLAPFNKEVDAIYDSFTNDKMYAKNNRLHPFSIFTAVKQYEAGKGHKGKLTWTPVPKITEGLWNLFHNSFETIEQIDKKIIIGLDVSGSMQYSLISDSIINCYEAAIALTTIYKRMFKDVIITAFTDGLKLVNTSPTPSVKEIKSICDKMSFSTTNLSLVPRYALENNIKADGFICITDNEINCGQNPNAVLSTFRKKITPNAVNIVVGMTATGFSVADPNDPYALDIAGFDTNCPQLIESFFKDKA
jgi:60 kDa SS-A/Ro ribonucleoprotein